MKRYHEQTKGHLLVSIDQTRKNMDHSVRRNALDRAMYWNEDGQVTAFCTSKIVQELLNGAVDLAGELGQSDEDITRYFGEVVAQRAGARLTIRRDERIVFDHQYEKSGTPAQQIRRMVQGQILSDASLRPEALSNLVNGLTESFLAPEPVYAREPVSMGTGNLIN